MNQSGLVTRNRQLVRDCVRNTPQQLKPSLVLVSLVEEKIPEDIVNHFSLNSNDIKL